MTNTNTMDETSRWLASRATANAVAAPERALHTVIIESGIHADQIARDWAWRVLWRIDRDAAARTYATWIGTRYGGEISLDEACVLLETHLASVRGR